ncbi:anthranilate synthase component I [bacterium]|nr:anthranilate synthase component I [bacterium]MBU3956553.1 anthranilate synthase component I [bacterium]MBU4133730.1 anthranilate synthase component I [bacterium]
MLNKLYPSFADFKKALKSASLGCLYTDVCCDMETPVSVFARLSTGENAFLLESAEGGIRWGRYSFVSPAAAFVISGGRNYFEVNGRRKKTEDSFGELKKFIGKYKFPKLSGDAPFTGGAVGYFSYDIAGVWEDIKAPAASAREEYFRFMLPEIVIVIDHLKKTMRIICWSYGSDSNARKMYSAAESKVKETLKKLRAAISHESPGGAGLSPIKTSIKTVFKSEVTQKHFEGMVRKAKKYISRGDCIQTVLSRRWKARLGVEPFRVYRALRMVNPSPYMYYLKFGDFQIIGSSPEILVRKDSSRAVLRPIAGTRPRGGNSAEDKKFAGELTSSEKECAEHIMLVDLARNDLGRVCSFDSVFVKELMTVEKFSHVMHMTSEVEGIISNDHDSFSLFKAAFPAGTVSGAPKVRAMQIISELEGSPRGPYAGAVGYFSFNGDMDFAITIRTVFVRGKEMSVQAGAGIVYDSSPSEEYRETENKAKALMRAVEIAEEF